MKEFSIWIFDISDGKLRESNDDEVDINIPNDLLIKGYSNPIKAIVKSLYPSLLWNNLNIEELYDSAILTPRLSTIEEVNSYMMSCMNGDDKEYLSFDLVCKTSNNRSYQVGLLTLEVLNALNCSDLSNH